GVSYFAMERIAGVTLRRVLADGPVPAKKLLSIAAQVAEGLSKAHAGGIVHRDLKPENIMVTMEGFVKILDFGLARVSVPVDEVGGATRVPTMATGTEPGVVLGTVAYMSPEQAGGRPVDFHSDQFSFGAILYEMITGRRAFARTSSVETLAAIIGDEPTSIA